MTPSLEGPRLKIGWAAKHLKALNRELSALDHAHSNTPVLNYTFDGTWHIIIADPVFKEPPPPDLSLICGDAIHNMRSALDYVVWQLVLKEGNQPDSRNAFPIFTKRKGFNDQVRNPRRPDRAPLHGIDPDGLAWELIEGHQPYYCRDFGQDPITHELAVVAKLSNIDKHRALHIHMLFPNWQRISDTVGWNPAAELLEQRIGTLPLSHKRETEIFRLRFSETGPEPQVHVKGPLFVHPSFGDMWAQVGLGSIKNAFGYIDALIEDFQQFFRDGQLFSV